MNAEVNTAYARRMAIWKALLFVSLLWLLADKVSAQAPPFIVQKDGVSQFGANCLAARDPTSPVYNFLTNCAPPINPPNDPNALTNILGKITSHACPLYSTSTGQNFASVFGLGYNPPATSWPYAPSTSVSMTLPPHGRYYGGVIASGLNPGITPHYLKLNGYAGSCVPPLQTPSTARFNVRVLPVGTMWVHTPGCTNPSDANAHCQMQVPVPAPTGRCSIVGAAPDNTPLVQLKFSGPVNSAHCLGVIGGTYRYIVENAGSTNVTTLLTWN